MVEKIPEKQLNAINQVKADGISADERKALELQGVKDELLEAISGTKTAEEVDKALEAYLKEQADSPSFGKNPMKWFKSDDVPVWKKVLVGAGVAAGAALCGWGLAALTKAAIAAVGLKGLAALGGLAVVGCTTFASCVGADDDPTETVQGNVTNINNNINFNVQVSDPALKKAVDSINERLEKIEKNQEQGNQYLNSIVALLTSLFAKISSIEAQGTEHTKLLTKIFECLNSHMTGTAENFDKLYAYLEKLNKTIETMDSNCAKYHELILEKLDTISGKLDTLSENNQTLFNLVLAELTSDRMISEESLAVLNKILEKIDNNETMDAKTHELLQKIITNQGKMNDDMNVGFLDILDNLGDLTDEVKDGFIKVIDGQNLTLEQLNTIINNQNAQSTQFEEIRELIVQNNKIAQGTQDAVKDMSASMTNEHDAILNAIKNVQAGGGDYSDLKAILEQIAKNTDVLPDMNKKLCLVGTAIEKILEEVKGIRVETQKGLLAILAKIPNGCTCKEVNLSGILEKLDELLAELKKDPADKTDEPGNNKDDHEGILKNLEDYFGQI